MLNKFDLLMKELSSKITVVIPALNEKKNISEVIRDLKFFGFSDILVVDGNSHDGTAETAKKLGAKIIHQSGKGKGDALRKAFGYAELGDLIVTLDADGSMDPGEIRHFLDALSKGSEVVKGSRFMSEGFSKDMTLFRRIGNTFFVNMVNLLWDTNFTDLCYGYMGFTKDAIQKICPHLEAENFEIETEIFIKAKKMGFKIQEIPSIEFRRKSGKSNLRAFIDGFRIMKTIFVEAIRN